MSEWELFLIHLLTLWIPGLLLVGPVVGKLLSNQGDMVMDNMATNKEIYYDIYDVYTEIRKRVSAAGSQKALSEDWGISQSYLSDVLNFHRQPGHGILRPLGLSRRTVYVRQQ
jgi:hypothetical protein